MLVYKKDNSLLKWFSFSLFSTDINLELLIQEANSTSNKYLFRPWQRLIKIELF